MDAAAESSTAPPPAALRLLSLDGGGIRGISILVMLEEIMHRVQRTEKLSTTPLPADYFDLICGTSTGGLIALLLGRLRLSVRAAIDKYRILAKQIFSEKKAPGKDGTFKASNLEKAIKDVVEGTLGPGHANEKMFVTGRGCKTFVCAVPAKHVNREPRLFRTWMADKNPGYNCTIWEAGRATSAAPTFFKRIRIGDPGLQEEFIDAGMGCNNPVRYLVEEAQREFGPVREVSCIVSIGTGKPKVAGFKSPGLFQRQLPLDLIKVLASMATDSEDEAKRMEKRYQHCPGLYHRLNVDEGLQDVSLEEWEKLGDVKTHTDAYLRGRDIDQVIDVIVAALIGRSPQTFRLGQLDGSVAGLAQTPPRLHYPSSQKVNYFVSRLHPQEEIRKHLQGSKKTGVPAIFVLLGMGGCGKSQLALEYCQQSEHDNSYSVIFWIDAISPNTVEQSFTNLARELSKPGFDIKDVEGNVQFVLATLKMWQGPWLLVFDNFDDPHSFGSKSIKKYFPRSIGGSILITSRDRAAKDLGPYIEIPTMNDEEALELLFRRSEATRSHLNLPEARKIVKRLGFHALAIDQAGAYIRAGSRDMGLFLEDYNKRRELLVDTPVIWDYTRKLKASPETETKLSVFTTWELSFDLITGDEEIRRDKEHLLTLIAFFDGNNVADTLFGPYSAQNSSWVASCTTDNTWDEYKFQAILVELRNLSLLQSLRIQKSGARISVHPLVQDWIKLRLNSESRRVYAIEATLVLSEFMETQSFNDMSLHTKQITFSHLEALILNHQECLSHRDRVQDISMLTASLRFARFLSRFGRYKSAEGLSRRTLEGRESLLGKEHPDTLTSMDNLAGLLESQGKYDLAKPLYQETLALREKVLGREHPDTLISMNNLAGLLKRQGKYDLAKPLYRETLAMREKVLGREHPDTLTSIHNLAELLERQGKYDLAEPLYRETLAMSEKVLGREHPDTLISINNLAELLESQGKYDLAEPLHQETLAMSEKVLGREHPDTLTSMNNLAGLLESQGKYDLAESLYRETLVMREEVLGREHPDKLTSMNNLAGLLERQGKYDLAEPLYRETLAMSEKVLGREHPDTLTSINNLAELLERQGKYDLAEPLHQETLAMREKVLGREHPNTLTSMNNLAGLLESQGKYDLAEPLYQETLALREKVLGREHPDTLTSIHNLAGLLERQGKYDLAEPLYREALAMSEKVLGREHPDTLTSMNSLAGLLESQGKYDLAEPLYRRRS